MEGYFQDSCLASPSVSACKIAVAGVGVFLSPPLGMYALSGTASIRPPHYLGGKNGFLRNLSWPLGMCALSGTASISPPHYLGGTNGFLRNHRWDLGCSMLACSHRVMFSRMILFLLFLVHIVDNRRYIER
jgi:hypothetical protein